MRRRGVAIGRPKRIRTKGIGKPKAIGKPKPMHLKKKNWKNNSKNPRFGINDSFRTRDE